MFYCKIPGLPLKGSTPGRNWTWDPGSPQRAEKRSLWWYCSGFLCVSLSLLGYSFLKFFFFFSLTLWKVASAGESWFMWLLTPLSVTPIPSPTPCNKLSPTFSCSLLPDAFDWLTWSHLFKTCPITSTQRAPALSPFWFPHTSIHWVFSQSPHTLFSKDISIDVSDTFAPLKIYHCYFSYPPTRKHICSKWTCFLLLLLLTTLKKYSSEWFLR